MSHVVTIETQIRDPAALAAACRRLERPAPLAGRHRLFAEEVEGLAVSLRDWRYPVVCRTAVGELRYDTFQGRWGDPARLDELLQAYAVEKATLEARRFASPPRDPHRSVRQLSGRRSPANLSPLGVRHDRT